MWLCGPSDSVAGPVRAVGHGERKGGSGLAACWVVRKRGSSWAKRPKGKSEIGEGARPSGQMKERRVFFLFFSFLLFQNHFESNLNHFEF